jgi:predicted flap endonuclease-1-like 5' DNA nuclease
MAYSVSEIEGIGPAQQAKFKTAGISTVDQLLERGGTAKGRKDLEEQTGLDSKRLLRFVNHADLFRINGIAGQFSELLEAAGVDTVNELKNRVPANLHSKLVEVNDKKNIVNQVPGLSQIEDFIAQAKGMSPMVTH